MRISYYDIIYHLENAEMTPELCDDLINFSFDNLWDVTKFTRHNSDWEYVTAHDFSPTFLGCLKRLVCYHITHTFFTYLFYDAANIRRRSHLPDSSS
jgi:hypothetical protein